MLTMAALFNVHWGDYTSDLGQGLVKTIEYTVAGFVGAALLGLVLALMRLSKARVVRTLAAIYTELVAASTTRSVITSMDSESLFSTRS